MILTSCMSIAVFSKGSTSWFMKSLDGAAPFPVTWVHECPPVKPFPGASMSCVAPAARMPSIAAWSFLRTKSVGCWPLPGASKHILEEIQLLYHGMWFVVNTEDHFWVVHKTASKLLPECLKLGCSCSVGVWCIADDLTERPWDLYPRVQSALLTGPEKGWLDGSL